MGAEFFHADRQTDRHDKANALFFSILRNNLKAHPAASMCKKMWVEVQSI